jgi:hypothetical protein
MDGYCELQLGKAVPVKARLVRTWTENPEEMGEIEFRELAVCEHQARAVVKIEGGAIASIDVSQKGVCLDGAVCIGSSLDRVRRHLPLAKLFMSQEEGRTLALQVSDRLTLSFSVDGIGERCWDDEAACKAQIGRAKLASFFLHTIR